MLRVHCCPSVPILAVKTIMRLLLPASELFDANRTNRFSILVGGELTPPFRHARPTPLTRLWRTHTYAAKLWVLFIGSRAFTFAKP
jgi:hypothetical protein